METYFLVVTDNSIYKYLYITDRNAIIFRLLVGIVYFLFANSF